METEGLETVHTSLGGNAVVPEGGSFLEPPSIARVPGEEIFRKQIDQVPCLAEKNEKQQKDEGFDTTEEEETKENAVVDETKQIAEQEQIADVTGTILKMDKIEGPCINIGEEDKIVKHLEAVEDGDAEVEGKPKSMEKEIGGPKKYEEGETKIEESVELETSKEVSSFEPSSSQGKEPLSQTADATINNLDKPEKVNEVCQEKEIKDSGTGDGTRTINEQQIGEQSKGEKSGSCSMFLDDMGTDVVNAIEKIENEKEVTACDTIGGGTDTVEAGIDIQREKKTTPETGEGMQDKRNTEDIATVTHKTQEKQTEEMYSQQVDKPDVCMVSETEPEENVNQSPQGEVQNLILKKTAESGGSEGENIKDEMNPEQDPDGLFVKYEENKQSMHQDLAMAEESTEESRDMEIPTVIAAENSTSDAVPITITAAQDDSVIADEDKIMDVAANIVPEHGKEEMSKYEDQIKETFAQQDEAGHENENSLELMYREIDTATSTECSEAIASSKEETPIKIPGEDFEDKKEEKPIDTDAVVDSGLPIEKGLPPTDLNEKIEDAGLELPYKNSSELHISHSLEQETMPVQAEKKPEDSDFEPQEQDHEANGQSKDLEKHAEDASEVRESMQTTDLENPSGEGAITTEVNSKANEMAVEREEKVDELESEKKLAIDDAGTNFEEQMQKKEEAHDEQTYEMATSDRIEEVTSDEVCSREFVDQRVERGFQAAGFQEAEIPIKNGVEESYEMSSLVNEEVIDEPKITDVEEVIDEEKIKDEATHLSSELVFEEKIAESSHDKETEAEMSKGDDVEEQMMEDDNAKVITRESIQEASVNDYENDGKNAEKSSREIYEVYEAEKESETNNNDEIPDVTLQASLLKEQESLQTENLTAEAEEKDEDRSSIRKEEDEDTNNGLKEVKECSEKETLKGEEDAEQISPRENLERSEDVALNKTTQKTEEEIDEGVEGIKKEAEIGKEDGEEQVIDENDDESIQVESIKEVPVSMVPNDENNAEEFKGEIFEESVTAGTNVSITDATYQNDGTPSAVLETSTVKQMEIEQGEDKDTTPAEALPEEEEEHDRARGLKRVEDNSSEIRLEGDLEKSDEETSGTIDAVAHEITQHIEFPNSTLETSQVEEQASLQMENLAPAENSPEGKKYEDGSSNKNDEDKEKNTGLAEETGNAEETSEAEENLEQILQNNTLVENPKQPINMICAETEADASSKMVDNREEEILEIPRGNAEAELLKEENIEGHVVEESNINSLSRESAEESPIKDFQNAAKNYEKSTEEMLESQIAGGDETHTNDEDCNSSVTVSVDKIDESFKAEDENITPAEASPHDEKEEHGSSDRADDGNDNNAERIVTNQDSSREALEVGEDFEQELQRAEPREPQESSTVMAAETEAGTLSVKTSHEVADTIQNIEETVEKEEHGSSHKEGEGNYSNPDITVANQDTLREASEVQDDPEQELLRIEPGEPEESSTIMASETEANTLSDKIDDVTSHKEVVTIQNIEETILKEEHGSLHKEGEGNDNNPDLTVANQDSVREALEVQDDSEQELSRIKPGELEESSTIVASEIEGGILSDKIDDVTSQEEVVTIQNIEETIEKEEHGFLDKEDERNDSNPDLIVASKDSVREASEAQDDSEQELPRIEPGEPKESSTIMASETERDTLSDKINDVTGQEEAVTIQNIEETVEKEEHGSSDKQDEGNDSNPDLTVASKDNVMEALEVQDDSEQELPRIEPGKPEESSTIMASEIEGDILRDKIDDVTGQEEVVTIQNFENTLEKEEHGSSHKGEGNDSNPDLTVANQDSVREASKAQDDPEQELPRIKPGEPEESSTIMASKIEADTLSDKIEDVTRHEEVVTIQNIEEIIVKEEHGSLHKEGEGNDSNPDLTVANQDSVREASEVQDDSEQELLRIEPGEPEESSTIMASETEQGTLIDKIDDVIGQEEAVTIQNIEETIEKEKHGSSDKEDKGNDSNPDLTVASKDTVREASEAQDDSEQELSRIEAGEAEESSIIMVSATEQGTLINKIDDVTGQEEAVTIQNIEETVKKEEHGSSDKEDEGNDSNPHLIVASKDNVREASKVQDDSKQELPRIELGEPEESSTIMASETEQDTLIDKIDDVTGQEEAITIQNIEETVEKEEHGSLDKEDEGNDSILDLIAASKDSVREASEVQDDSEQELSRIKPGEPEESSTIMASKIEGGILSDKIDDVTGKEKAVTIQNIEETVKKEEHGSSDKEDEGNNSNPDQIMANRDNVREASEVQDDPEQELPGIEPREPEESSTIMASKTEADTLSDKIDDVTRHEEGVTIQNIEETIVKEEHGSSHKEGEGNDNNPDLTVANQDSVREASEVQDDSEQELPRNELGEPEESSTIMASETEDGTVSDKIDDVISHEEAVTIQNIEETVEKEEHGSLDKEGEGNDSNPDLTMANQDSVREALEAQDDSEQKLSRIKPGELEESSTIVASEIEGDILSNKIDDVTSQEEAVTIQNIEETIEKEEHGFSDKEDERNDSNPDLIAASKDSVREASEVQDDSKQELSRIEPGKPVESSTIMAFETEEDTLSDKIDDITTQEEVVTIHSIEDTSEKEKKEGSDDLDVTKVERAVMEEDVKLVAEASDANKSVENDAEENIISGGKEVETAEKTFGLDSIQKLEVEEKRDYKVEETKDEDIKEVCGETKLASLSVDTEKYVTAEEHTNTDISPHTAGETTTEEKAKTVNEMEESVITNVDEDAEKKVPEEETAINDQSRIIYKGDESGLLVEKQVHEIIRTSEEYGDTGKQGSVVKDNYEVPLRSTNEENPLHQETEDESDPNNEVKDSKSEFTEPFESRGLVDRQEFETLRGKQGPSSDIYLEKASEEVSEKESNKSLIEISCESESKGEILEEVQPDVNDSSSTLITGITRETSFKEAEPEDKRQIESFDPAPQEKGPVTESTERITRGSMDIDAKPEDANYIENEDHGIPAASEAEELEKEMHQENPKTGSEDHKEETTNETPLGSVLDDKQEKCSAKLPKEPELMTNEGNKAADENPTTYENIETPQTPQEIEIMLKEDMPINERDASKSLDPRKESIKEEVGSYQLDSLNEHHELDNEKQEAIDISKSSEVRDLTNQGEICKLMSLEDEYSSNVGDEALKCIEATSAERKEAILEEDSLTKKPEDSLAENVEANKAAFELEERTDNQEQAIGTEDYGVLPEKNFEVSESGKKLEGVSETETGDQSSQNIPEAYSGKVENSTEIQNKSLKSIEQSSQESQEVREETGEKTELRFETEGDVRETQNTDETVKDVLLTEEVHEKVDEAGSETLESTEKDVNDTRELCEKSTEDERVHEVKESGLIAGECHDATESNEQTTIMSSDFQEAPTMEEMSLAKAINDEDNEMPAALSTTTPAEELDEMIEIIKEEDSFGDKIKATTMVEITETSLEEAQLDEKPVQVSNITSNDSVSLEIEAEACQEEKVKDNVGLELPSLNLASQIPIDDHKNIMREQAKENTDADDVQENERASGVVYESKDHGIEELITSKIKEENEESAEIGESPGAEAAANEAAIDQNPPEVISKEEQGISATTERREENMKDEEFREDDLRKTEGVSLQKDDDREERDISQLELQPYTDTQNQSPKEALEEECGTPGETKEEIKEGPKVVSMTNSQGFEALKEDESTSGHTVPEEKSEEQNQTPAVALLSKEKDCGLKMIIESIDEYVHVELPADPQNYSPPKITEDTCLREEEPSELEVSGLGAELNTGIQKDSLYEVQVKESKSPDDDSKLQIPEYETSKEAFESMPEVHGLEGFTASEETEIKEKHLVVAITDLEEEENRGEKLIDSAEIMHDGVIEEGTFEGTSNLRTELSKEAAKSISEVYGHEVLAISEDTEIKVKHPEETATDMAAEENPSERTIDATEIIHDKLKSEVVTKRENQQIMEEREDAKNGDSVTLGEETTKECHEEYELKAEESLGDKGTQKDIQNEELYKEVEKADESERNDKQMDTERIIEHLHLAAAENETIKESFLNEAGSEMHLEHQICETASGNDGKTETANVKEEEMDVEISHKEGPSDLVEASETTRDIHGEEDTSKTTTEHIEEHVKEVEIEVDEHPSATKTAENTFSQKEETTEQEECGSGVECNMDMQKNGLNEFNEEAGRAIDEDSTLEPQGYENKIKDKEYLPESNKMTELTETGAFEKTSDLWAETSEETSKSMSEVHELGVLAESEHAEIKKEKHTEVAVTDLVAGENQNKKTIDATEVVHYELTNEELAKQDKQQFKEEKEDTENCKPINLGEETAKESHQIYDLKAKKSHEDKMESEIQNEEVSNESREYLHQTAVKNETINESFPDEALVKNAEDMETKLQVETHSDEKNSGYDRTEAITITNEEFGADISEKESLQDAAEANETTQDIHQGERDSYSTSEKPVPLEAETQETTKRKKDAPQGLLQEPIVESTQGAEVGESEPGKATGIVDAQGFEHKAETSIDEKNVRGNDESMSANISLFDMMQSSTRELQVKGDLTEEKEEENESKDETRVEGEKTKSDEEKEEEEERKEHKTTDSPVMVEASRDVEDVKVASKKHHNILSGVGSKVKHSISKVKKAITGKSSHPKQHSPK